MASGATLLLFDNEDENEGSEEEDANGAALLDMYNDVVGKMATDDTGCCGNLPK